MRRRTRDEAVDSAPLDVTDHAPRPETHPSAQYPGAPEAVAVALAAARDLLGDSHLPGRYAHVGRVQWLIDLIENGEGDVWWYAVGAADRDQRSPDWDPGVEVVSPAAYAAIWTKAAETVRTPVDLSPFRDVLAEIETRMRAHGGGAQDAYANAAMLLRSAFNHYRED